MKPNDVMKALECCVKVGGYRDAHYCKDCPLHEERCALLLPQNALTLIREKDAEIEMLKEVIDTSSDVVDYAVDKIREARASMLDEARRLSFEAGDQQYISIAELEKIAKGNAE